MKYQVFCFLLLQFFSALSQDNVITITDYSKLLVAVNKSGDLVPVTASQDMRHVGFFLTAPDEGFVRICPGENPLSFWINGQHFDQLDSCQIYQPEVFFSFGGTDTLYLAFSSSETLEGFGADLIRFRERQVIREDPAFLRYSFSSFGDFVVISTLIILIFYGVSVKAYPSRVKYIIEKAFSVKESTYEFVNTSFLTGSSLYLILLLSLLVGFCAVYFESILEASWKGPDGNILFFLQSWMKYFIWIFAFIYFKWFLILIVSKLFQFRGVSDYQLFDFLNVVAIVIIPVFLFCCLDYAVNSPADSWVSWKAVSIFPLILIFVVLWFTLKFVSISSSKKLSIISYLCATEFIPAVTLLVWFYK